MHNEGIQWKVKTTLEKRHGDINACKSPEERLRFLAETEPYDVVVKEGNLLLNAGMDLVLSLMTGQGGDAYTNAAAQIGVGNGDAAAVRTQTALQGASTDYQGMESGFPTAPAENAATDGRQTKFKSSWGSGDGNFVWAEWVVRNKASAGTLLNRKVEALGTKSTGTWTLEVEISIK